MPFKRLLLINDNIEVVRGNETASYRLKIIVKKYNDLHHSLTQSGGQRGIASSIVKNISING